MEDIARSLSIFVGIAHEIIDKDVGYSKVSWAAGFMLTQEHNQKRVELPQQCLCCFEKEADDFFKSLNSLATT